MKINDLIKNLEVNYPSFLAYDFDNPGLNVGDGENIISGILIALDIDKDAIDLAKINNCNLILTHHPLIFDPIKNVASGSMTQDLIIDLIKNNISVYSMHTNFDVKHDIGMGDIVSDMLFDKNEILEEYYIEKVCDDDGLGKFLLLKNKISINDIKCRLVDKLKIDESILRIYSKFNLKDNLISNIAILPGSGKSDIDKIISLGADVYLSGDLSHNHILELLHNDISYIDCTHYGLEKIFVDFIYVYLSKELKNINIYKYENKYM